MKTYRLETDESLKTYDYLWRLSNDRWAWEYLRRNGDFLEDAKLHSWDDISEMTAPCANIRLLRSRVPQKLASRWGLVFMPDPKLNGIEADAVWLKTAFPDQVEVNCTPRAEGQSCDIWDRTVPHCRITHITDRAQREFLLLRGNGCVAQVRCTGLSLLGMEPVRMKLQISDMEAYERKLKAQKDAFRIYGDDPEIETPMWSKRTQMLRDGLIALDCLALGMTQREIAVVLYGKATVEAEWGVTSMKSTTRYLVNKAKALRDGGYLVELLGSQLGPNQLAA
ncbi:MAG: DUF2285 domain-containing protein [Hyphomonas sp.]|nr:DUF2285 domain-containing protein [Hyphomonas sp.]